MMTNKSRSPLIQVIVGEERFRMRRDELAAAIARFRAEGRRGPIAISGRCVE